MAKVGFKVNYHTLFRFLRFLLCKFAKRKYICKKWQRATKNGQNFIIYGLREITLGEELFYGENELYEKVVCSAHKIFKYWSILRVLIYVLLMTFSISLRIHFRFHMDFICFWTYKQTFFFVVFFFCYFARQRKVFAMY